MNNNKNMEELMAMIGEATNEKIKHTNFELYSVIRLIVIFFSLITILLIVLVSLFFYDSDKKPYKQIIKAEKKLKKNNNLQTNQLNQSIYLFKTKCLNNRTLRYYRKNDGIVFEYYTISIKGC